MRPVWLILAAIVVVTAIVVGITRHTNARQSNANGMASGRQPARQTNYGKVYLLPMAEEDPQLMEALSSAIKESLGMGVDRLPATTPPRQAWDASRGQYNVFNILTEIDRNAPTDATRVLGIVNDDIYTPELNFVFSQGVLNRRPAIVSTYRLKQGVYGAVNHKLLVERTTKTAVKALAFSLGVQSCQDRRCIMVFANNMAELDRKSNQFCPTCAQALESALKRQFPAR